MAGNVTLTASMRTNLLQLQSTQSQIDKKQNILSTGNKINSALDGPTSFFAAKGLNQRAGDLKEFQPRIYTAGDLAEMFAAPSSGTPRTAA